MINKILQKRFLENMNRLCQSNLDKKRVKHNDRNNRLKDSHNFKFIRIYWRILFRFLSSKKLNVKSCLGSREYCRFCCWENVNFRNADIVKIEKYNHLYIPFRRLFIFKKPSWTNFPDFGVAIWELRSG